MGRGEAVDSAIIRFQSFSEPELGISLPPGHLGFGKNPSVLGPSKTVPLENKPCEEEQGTLGVFQNSSFTPPLPEAGGDFSLIFTVRTSWGS